MWCTCSKIDGYGYIDQSDYSNTLLIHRACGCPARQWFEAVTLNRIPRGATSMASVYGRSDGVNELTFLHPEGKKVILTVIPYHRRPFAMGELQTDILLFAWQRLDHQILLVKSLPEGSPAYIVARAKAAEVCEILAVMMPPFFTTAREVADEALRRYESSDPDYETPGLGVDALKEFEHKPVSRGILTPATRGSAPVAISEDVAANIKKGLASGLFTAAQLAASYKVPVAAVEALRAT